MKSQSGIAFIITILFVFILSLLALAILQTTLIETKMSNYDVEKTQAFYAAEVKLTQYEQKLEHAEVISTDICGVTFYRVTALSLQSTYAKLGDTSHCDPKPIVKEGRQSWRVMF